MEIYNQPKDLKLFYVTAASFPEGVEAAFKQLEQLIGSTDGRVFFGISDMYQGSIRYKAAVLEAFDGEAEKRGCQSFVLKQGTYLVETVFDWCDHKEQIGAIFQKLLADSRLDTNFPCVEWYKSEREMMCMVKIKE